MSGYVVRRLLSLPLIALGLVTIVFFVMRVIPGDVARLVAGPEATEQQVAQVRVQLNLNRNIAVQYLDYVRAIGGGDFGSSIYTERAVLPDLLPRFENTALLALTAVALSTALGLTLGLVSAARRGSSLDAALRVIAAVELGFPSFFFGLILIFVFAARLRLLPALGDTDPQHLILPALTLAIPASAAIARMTRGSVLDVLDEDYMRTARAKGLSERRALLRHALKPALLPVVTIIGLELGSLLGGAVVVETVFAYPGAGAWIVQSIQSRDFPVVQAGVIVIALSFSAINAGIDVLYAWLEPRIRYS